MSPRFHIAHAACGPRRSRPHPRRRHRRGGVRGAALCAVLAVALTTPLGSAGAEERGDGDARAADRGGGAAERRDGDEQVFDFSGLDIGGRLRTPQLLYFLDRAREELGQASLKRRSFLPEMIRSVDEESL